MLSNILDGQELFLFRNIDNDVSCNVASRSGDVVLDDNWFFVRFEKQAVGRGEKRKVLAKGYRIL